MPARRALLLDRDGVLNVEIHRLHRAEDVVLIPGAAKTIATVNGWDVPVVVVTNQAGIGHGMYGEADYRAVNRRIDELLAIEGAHVDAYFHCPHVPDAQCDCRKPAPGLLLQAEKQLDLDLARSVLVGDKRSDLEAARAVGCTPILARTGYGRAEETELRALGMEPLPFTACVDDLPSALSELEKRLR